MVWSDINKLLEHQKWYNQELFYYHNFIAFIVTDKMIIMVGVVMGQTHRGTEPTIDYNIDDNTWSPCTRWEWWWQPRGRHAHSRRSGERGPVWGGSAAWHWATQSSPWGWSPGSWASPGSPGSIGESHPSLRSHCVTVSQWFQSIQQIALKWRCRNCNALYDARPAAMFSPRRNCQWWKPNTIEMLKYLSN